MEVSRDYYHNGQLMYEHSYHQGKRHGINKGWYVSGQLWYECQYHQGQRHGICRGYHRSGKPLYEEYYLYGKEVTQEEYRKHELIIQLAGINNGSEKRILP